MACPSARRKQIDPLRFQDVAGIGQACLNVVGAKMIVLTQDLLLRPATAQHLDDELDRNASSLHDRFADQDVWINCNSLTPVHGSTSLDCQWKDTTGTSPVTFSFTAGPPDT